MRQVISRGQTFFAILGAAKCGTTSLASWLGRHRKIFMCEPKEPEFFNTDFRDRRTRYEKEYLGYFKAVCETHGAVGEASVLYLPSRVAVPALLRWVPDAKFFVMVRNPVEMAMSLHAENLASGIESETNFAKAWALQAQRRTGRGIPHSCLDPVLLQYGEMCRLGEQVSRLLSVVDKERVRVFTLDEMRAAPVGVYVEALGFLEIEDDGWREVPALNPRKVVAYPMLARFAKSCEIAKRAVGIRRGLGLLSVIRRVSYAVGSAQAISESVCAEMRSYFSEDVTLLGRLIGKDLSGWVRGY